MSSKEKSFAVAKVNVNSELTWKFNMKANIEDAVLAFTLGEEKKAKKLLMEILEDNPESIEAWRALAEVLLSLNHFEDAEKACRQALNLNSNDLASMVSLSRILVRLGDKDGAEKATAKARILGWKEELANEDPN